MTSEEKNKETVYRNFNIPGALYYDVIDENTLAKRQGLKRNSEQEFFSLVEEGLRFRKLMRSADDAELIRHLSPEELGKLKKLIRVK